MAILASELIFNIKNLRAGGVQSDDEQISDRQFYFIINYYRAKLVRQEQFQYGATNRSELQDLGQVDLIMSDPHECGCPEIDACILRTENAIPKTLSFAGRDHAFTFVGMYGGMSWQEQTWQSGPWSTFAPYTGENTKWILKGDYIYIINPPTEQLTYMNIQGVFEDPLEAEQFRTCDCDDDTPCVDSFDFEYPIEAHLIDTLMKMIMESEVTWSTLIPQDTSNDSLDTN